MQVLANFIWISAINVGVRNVDIPAGSVALIRRGLLINDNRMSNAHVREWSRGDASDIDGQTDWSEA